MAVTRTVPAAASLIALATVLTTILAGCGSAPQQPGRAVAGLPGLGKHPPRHGGADPDLPVLPSAGSGRGGYYQDDGPGENPPANLRDVPDAEVRAEPYSRYANRPYVVFGKTYTPLLNDQPFVQRGVSSWYGKKFHGQRTSSGELYDMYKMTAAHPTLPIPSYARITSLESGKQVVVRINDRGPFHASRIVDVSYTAALKLGLLDKGSHKVEIERILPNAVERLATIRRNAPVPEDPPQVSTMAVDMPAASELETVAQPAPVFVPAPVPADPAGAAPVQAFYLQLGAFSQADKADAIRARLASASAALGVVEVVSAGALHRLFSGPFASRADALDALRAVPEALGLKPIVVRR